MKKWVLMLGVFGVFGAFPAWAAGGCSYVLHGVPGYGKYLDLSKAEKTVNRKLGAKGFAPAYDPAQARYTVEFFSDWDYGAWNGLEHGRAGDAQAYVKLIRNSDGAVVYSQSRGGVSGVIGSVGRGSKARILLKAVLADLPECAGLLENARAE